MPAAWREADGPPSARLGLILDAASPSGAYELLDRLRQTRRSAAPPTVYRTLDFLRDQGLIHKVERLSAFVGCVAGCTADPDEEAQTHAAQFLICRDCGRVIEMRNHDVSRCWRRPPRRGVHDQWRDRRGGRSVQHVPLRHAVRGELRPAYRSSV